MTIFKKVVTRVAAIFIIAGLEAVSHAASGAAEFTIDNIKVVTSGINISAGVELDLNYAGSNRQCTDVEWYFRKEGEQSWNNFDHESSATLAKIFRSGRHTLKMTARGFDNRWFFKLFGCNRSGQYAEKEVVLNIETPGYTQTKHPIMLVPGVMAWDSILGIEYFYRVADMIREESDQPVKDVSLQAWQNTEERGADLANKVLDFLVIHDDDFFSDESTMKVNLIAHSHGSTTSRVAVNILAKEFGKNAKVASLTTVAGPHYGTPVADATVWAMENWGATGKLLSDYLIEVLIGDIAGAVVSILSGHAGEYRDQEALEVLYGFTQKGMARFNTCYPSVGLPTGGKYFFEEPLEGNDSLIDFPVAKNGELTISDCQKFQNISNTDGEFNFVRSSTFSATQTIELADTPDEAYGFGTVDLGDGVYGNGLGERRNSGDDDAIRYFSFTGVGEWNTKYGSNILELSDPALLVINSLFTLTGEKTDQSYFTTWVGQTAVDLLGNNAVARDKGFTKNSDAFIPVDSTKFGEHIGTFGPWNHVDEQNGLFAWVSTRAEDPITIYRTHINRLQLSGL